MFSSPNVTGGFGTLGTPNPQQSTLGLPNSVPAMSMQSNVGLPNAYASTSGIILPAPGSTSSPGFTFNANTPASLQGQLPLSLAGAYGMNNASNTPNTGSGMLGVPPGMGFTRGAGTPGAQSVSGQSQGQARKQAGADEGGLSIDAALKGLEEAMAAVVKMEELLMGIKADQERVFGGNAASLLRLSGSEVITKAEGTGVVGQAEDAGDEQGHAGMVQEDARQRSDQADVDSTAGGMGDLQDTVVLQRLQQSRLEYSQLQQALQQHLLSTTLGSLPLHHHHASPPTTSDPSAPDATTSDGNANATAVPGQEQAMSVVELISWAEARAERDFGHREGLKEGARVVLDALKLR